MIYTVIADIKELTEDYTSLPLRKEVIDHINSAENQSVRRERAGAYLVLSAITESLFRKNPIISWSKNGKPRYDGEGIYFNLSHSKNVVAVGISDEGEIGVDIEAEIDPERAKRLEFRFFADFMFCDSPLNVTYIFGEIFDKEVRFKELKKADISENGLTLNKKIKIESANFSDCFSAKWTLYEATMKSGGGGFASLPCLSMLLLETCADIKKIETPYGIFFATTAKGK